MTAKLPPLPDVEQELYEKCRRFVPIDAQEAIGDIMHSYALQAVRDALEPVGELLDALEAEASAKLSMENAVENFTNAQPEIDIAAKSMARASEAAKRVRALLKEYSND